MCYCLLRNSLYICVGLSCLSVFICHLLYRNKTKYLTFMYLSAENATSQWSVCRKSRSMLGEDNSDNLNRISFEDIAEQMPASPNMMI